MNPARSSQGLAQGLLRLRLLRAARWGGSSIPVISAYGATARLQWCSCPRHAQHTASAHVQFCCVLECGATGATNFR